MNLANRIKKQIPPTLMAFLERARQAAVRNNVRIYLVGGAVRDTLLGRDYTDVDLVVEGDALALVYDINLSRAKINPHQEFGTVSVKWQHYRADLATARSEIYIRPGALPQVKPDALEKDLFRRDFTVNAMAVSLNHDNYGELIDPYGGLSDLKGRRIRVLHENSFIDDATRFWRAVRYEQRLDFQIEPGTLRLFDRDHSMLDTISGDRVRHELERFLTEKLPEKAFIRANDLKLLSRLHPALEGNGWLAARFAAARKIRLSDTTLETVYLALLIYRLQPIDLEQLTGFLHFNRLTTKTLRETIDLREKLRLLANYAISPSQIYFSLYQYSSGALLASSIATDSAAAAKHIDDYLSHLKYIKPRLNGDDLKRIGITEGAEVNRLLHLLHAARLDGKTMTKQGEFRMLYGLTGKKPALE